MAVFVLDQRQRPLMPCSERKARLLLSRKRAVVHRLVPFTIRLKDRLREESALQTLVLKLDPGSHTSGMALTRVEETPEGEVHHALHLSELTHRGEQVHQALVQRAGYRRRRRSANLRYRSPRFQNRRRARGWLPPSLRSRIANGLTWAWRYSRCAPVSRIEIEQVKFDVARMQNPELTDVAYQRGDLFGWEVRAYVLAKFGYRCAYCGRGNTAFELDHIMPRSRGGTDRVANVALSCHDCNVTKGSRTAAEFAHPEVEALAKVPLKDAAAVNATRLALVEALRVLGLPIGTWSGGRTRWNRERFGIEKAHALDALCVGKLAGVRLPSVPHTLDIRAQGRGSYRRTNVDAAGFPRGYLTRQKRIGGFSTGDLVRAEVPDHLKTRGIHLGRVAVRATRSFRVGKVDGINAKYCLVVQRADGYGYALR